MLIQIICILNTKVSESKNYLSLIIILQYFTALYKYTLNKMIGSNSGFIVEGPRTDSFYQALDAS